MNKQTLKIIDQLSKRLQPETYHASDINTKITGEDVLLTNCKEINGEEVVFERDYTCKVPLIRKINHKLRMKKAYNKNGKAGLMLYLKPYCEPKYYGQMQTFIMHNMK
jgi:hypothetical protein